MEGMLAILVALGLFTGIPCVIGFGILGAVRLAGVVPRKPVVTEARV